MQHPHKCEAIVMPCAHAQALLICILVLLLVVGMAGSTEIRGGRGNPAFPSFIGGEGLQPRAQILALLGGYLPQPPSYQAGDGASISHAWHS